MADTFDKSAAMGDATDTPTADTTSAPRTAADKGLGDKLFSTLEDFKNSDWVRKAQSPESQRKIKAKFSDVYDKVQGSELGEKAKTLYQFFLDPTVSTVKKSLIAGALLYFIMPFDIVPDFIPLVGWLDDLGVIAMVIKYISNEVEKYSLQQEHPNENVTVEDAHVVRRGSQILETDVRESRI